MNEKAAVAQKNSELTKNLLSLSESLPLNVINQASTSILSSMSSSLLVSDQFIVLFVFEKEKFKAF